jgi:hypothetical protein
MPKKKEPSIRLSEKHGVNPCLGQCYLCGGDTNEIALLGRLKGDAEAPRRAVVSYEPCDTCKGYMQQGIIFISVKDNDKDYRTGGFCVLKESAVSRMGMPPKLEADVLKQRVCFIEDTVWNRLGLPRGDVEA